MRPGSATHASDGFALVIVLVFMLVVSAVVVPFAISAKTRLMIASNTFERQRLGLLADGLINILSRRLSTLPPQVPANGGLVRCQAGRFTFAARIQDHRGLIDLNAGDASQLAKGFAALDSDPVQAAELAEIAVASRSAPDAFSNNSGAKSWQEAKLKSAPFESVSELAFLARPDGMRLDETYRIFTVHSRLGSVDPGLAPAVLRQRLGVDGEAESSTGAGDVYSLQVRIGTGPSTIAASAGYVVARAGDGLFQRVSQLPPLSASGLGDTPLVPCPALFGKKPAQLIAEWANG